MPFLNKIVEGLNAKWLNSSLKFIPKEKVKCYGISEAIIDAIIKNEDVEKTRRFPAMVDNNGEATMIDVDDSYQIIIYHKLESIANNILPKQAFGDSQGELQEVANMAIMVIAFRDKIRKPAYWLEAALKDGIPQNMKMSDDSGKQIQLSFIKIGNSSFDKLALLQREFSEVELNYPNLIVFETKYRIESTYKQGCFINNCGC